MKVLDLFSGIGGFSLGLERAGMRTVAFCEIDPYCRGVLASHWPGVPIFEDVRALRGADVGPVDVIAGGFPCQDISSAGLRVGIGGARSGLWVEYRRLIGELRPRYAIVENVSDLLARGLGDVLGDLAEIGYDAEWHCIPASAVGAPHRRDRVWIVAYPSGDGLEEQRLPAEGAVLVADAAGRRGLGQDAAVADADRKPKIGPAIAWPERDSWDPEPAVGRVAHGIPHKLAAPGLSALGNAVVPQIPELIGRAIFAVERMT